MRRIAAIALLAAALVWGGATVLRDDDRPVDPALPEARQAATAALEVVPGRVREVARDELEPESLGLLRLDYD